jgi:endonuclease III
MSQIFLKKRSKGGKTALSFSAESLVKIIKKFSLTKRRAANAQAARNSIISQFQQFVKRKFAQKLNKIFSRICTICLLHFPLGWCIIVLQG